MRAKLKVIHDLFGEFNPDEYFPEDEDVFHVSLLLGIGVEDGNSMDYFDVLICTPKWIKLKESKPLLLRYTIIVECYDFKEILKCINSYIDNCDGDNWEEISHKLSRFFRWEFDDYKP